MAVPPCLGAFSPGTLVSLPYATVRFVSLQTYENPTGTVPNKVFTAEPWPNWPVVTYDVVLTGMALF